MEKGRKTMNPSPSPRPAWVQWLAYAGLILLSLATTAAFMRPNQCETLCSANPRSSFAHLEGANLRAIARSSTSPKLDIWVDIATEGVYSPTMKSSTLSLSASHPNGDQVQPLPSYLDELAEKGYLAIRVPHAPPTYTRSSLIPGHPWNPHAVEFTYYSPPTSTTKTTVPVSVTRIVTYETTVNNLYPITDGKSHWEVWGLEDKKLPIPTDTFRLKKDWPSFIEVMFQIDFADAPATAAAGQPVEFLLYNGYNFIGPFQIPLIVEFSSDADNPLAVFDQGCGEFGTYLQHITPTTPFSHSHWLANYDTVTRTFTITAHSSENWTYTYYYGHPLQPAAGLPFTVTVGPGAPGWPQPPCVRIAAVHTPTIAISDTMRETFWLTATSTVSPEVQASIVSFALAPGYQLNEGGGKFTIYLPLVLRSSP
ncbi:MAG TPA: hypothetical protein ENJ31_10555 [Anaerolineae bacterium]|nr:hypothetical protein [Anaerolineae bacterium]